MVYKRRILIVFFVIAVLAFVVGLIIPLDASWDVIAILVSLVHFVFACLAFAWSIKAIIKKDLSLGITFLVITSIFLLLWLTGFFIGFFEGSTNPAGDVIFNVLK